MRDGGGREQSKYRSCLMGNEYKQPLSHESRNSIRENRNGEKFIIWISKWKKKIQQQQQQANKQTNIETNNKPTCFWINIWEVIICQTQTYCFSTSDKAVFWVSYGLTMSKSSRRVGLAVTVQYSYSKIDVLHLKVHSCL